MANVLNKYGWDTITAPYSCNYISPKILKLLRLQSVNRICDVGSGNGALAGELYREGYSVVGVEYSDDGVNIAKTKYPDIKFYKLGVQDDPEQLVKTEGNFEAVISTEVIEHLFSPHQLPIFCRGLLKEEGILIISTPYHGYLKNLVLSLFNKWDHHHTALWEGGHIKFWSRATLSKLLEKNGFKIEEFYGVGRCNFLWKSMIIVARKV